MRWKSKKAAAQRPSPNTLGQKAGIPMSVKDVVLRLALSALAAIAIPIAVAQASPVTVSQTSTFNTYLQSGDASLTGTFDMNSLISGGGPTYNISSGTLSVHAYSFAQYGAGVAQNYTGYTDPYGTIISWTPRKTFPVQWFSDSLRTIIARRARCGDRRGSGTLMSVMFG